MRLDATGLTFSATDLANFSACSHRTLLDRLRAHGLAKPPFFPPDPRMELLKQRGVEHERAYLEELRKKGDRVVELAPLPKEERVREGYAKRAAETVEAMRSGADVIYQGVLFDDAWLGFADFLIRVDKPSTFGTWSYEVVDAKLTREAKATAVLQTCVYSELLARVQGAAPERIHLFLGGPTPRLASFRLAHYSAYYRALKRRFLVHVGQATNGNGSASGSFETPIATAPGIAPDPLVALGPPNASETPIAPEPVELCQLCEWRPRCDQERSEVDHLSLVSGILRDQRRALKTVGVSTMAALAAHPLDSAPAGFGSAASYQRIREQARMQVEGRSRSEPLHEILPHETQGGAPPLGLLALPEPSEHDWFFDIEGADYAYDHGLEYLFGVTDTKDEFSATWALSGIL